MLTYSEPINLIIPRHASPVKRTNARGCMEAASQSHVRETNMPATSNRRVIIVRKAIDPHTEGISSLFPDSPTPPAVVPASYKVKAPHEMTLSEYLQHNYPDTRSVGHAHGARYHYREVSDALLEGKEVPAHVLADYPDLTGKTQQNNRVMVSAHKRPNNLTSDPEFERAHPRAGEGGTRYNPETGKTSRGGQFAAKEGADNEQRSAEEDQRQSGRMGQDVPSEHEGESPESVSGSRSGRKAGRNRAQAAEASGSTPSLFDQAGDESAGSASGSGSRVPDGAERGGQPRKSGKQRLVAVARQPAAVGSLFDAFDDNGPANPANTAGDNPPSVPLASREDEHDAQQAEAPSDEALPLSNETQEEVDAGLHTFSSSRKKGLDYRITDSDNLGSGGTGTKYANNIAAIKLLKHLQAEGRMANAEEQAVLVKYTGWGWASRLFHTDNLQKDKYGQDEWRAHYYKGNEWWDRYAELKSLLTPEEFEGAAGSVVNAHYTSDAVIKPMWEAVRRLGFTGGRVLEPSAGVGHFFGLMPEGLAANSFLSAVELDPTSAAICQQLYQTADVQATGFQNARLADGYFDLAISNVPFGSYGVADAELEAGGKKYLTASIHNYFFAKALTKVRPGGIVAFITSTQTMDGEKWKRVREHLSKEADFLGAVRLPASAFKENAGTEVTTDLIFLRKRLPNEPAQGQDWHSAGEIAIEKKSANDPDKLPINGYYVQHPEMLLGTPIRTTVGGYHGEDVGLASDGRDIEEALPQALATLPENIYRAQTQVAATDPAQQARFLPAPDDVKMGAFADVNGKLMIREPQGMLDANLTGLKEKRVRGLIGVRGAIRKLMKLEVDPNATDEKVEAARSDLNRFYNRFVSEYGKVNDNANVMAFKADPDFATVASLERVGEDGNVTRGPILDGRVNHPFTYATHADSAADALAITLSDHHALNWNRMAELTGRTPDSLRGDLANAGLIYHNPTGDWETADGYLSGDVREKLRTAEAAAKNDPRYDANVKALRDVQPPLLSPAEIEVKLGAGWVPTDVVHGFLQHLVGMPGHTTENEMGSVRYTPAEALWNIKLPRNARWLGSARNTQEFGTKDRTAVELLSHILNAQPVKIYVKGEDEKPHLDPVATAACEQKMQAIRDEWHNWTMADEDRATRLAGIYNEKINVYTARKFNGSHLQMPGLSGVARERLNDHVKHAVWRIVQSPNTLAAHAVGAGKTWCAAIAAMELRRTGLARKPMIVVPNHLVGQWVNEFQLLYPGANVLMGTKKDFEKENRRKFLAKVATGDWDAVIISHGSFGRIPVSPDRIESYYKEQIDALEQHMLEVAEEEGERSPTFKQLRSARNRLEVKMEKRMKAAHNNEEEPIPFEELGVDRLIADEFHLYKNLGYASKRAGVKGLPNTDSNRAIDMLLKCRHIQERNGGGGVVGLTGTPVSNTIAELYTMSRYIDPKELEKRGMSHFDSWANAFAEERNAIEQRVTGEYKPTTRFARFSNVPELSNMFRQYADVLLPEDLNLPRPEAERITVENAMSPQQAAYTKSLERRAEKIANREVEPDEDNMLKITGDGRKNLLDYRLVDPTAGDWADSKINNAARKIKEEWDGTHAIKGAQVVFLDLSTPKAKNAGASEALQEDDKVGTPEEETAKYITKIKNPDARIIGERFAQAYQQNDEAGLEKARRDASLVLGDKEAEELFGDLIERLDPAGDTIEEKRLRDSLYHDLKEKLVSQGIPANQIAFIHDANTDARKVKLFQDVKAGHIRVLLGSTEKMGTGMNAQDRMVALHHLDCPWRPADLEQREGRILRKGNMNKKVRIYNYVTRGSDEGGSMDGYFWQTIQTKAHAIHQIMKGDPAMRSCDDVGDEELTAAKLKAIGSGNPLIMEEAELQAKLGKMSAERSAHEQAQWRAKMRLKEIPTEIEDCQKNLRLVDRAITYRNANQGEKPSLTISGQTFDKADDAAKQMIELAKQVPVSQSRVIANFNGFHVSSCPVTGADGTPQYYVRVSESPAVAKAGTHWESAPIPVSDSGQGMVQKLRNALGSLDTTKNYFESRIASSKADIPVLEGSLKPYPRQDELNQAAGRLNEIHRSLAEKERSIHTAQTEIDEEEVAKAVTPRFRSTDLPKRFEPVSKSLQDGKQPHPVVSRIEMSPVPGLHRIAGHLGLRHYGSYTDSPAYTSDPGATTHHFAAADGKTAVAGLRSHLIRRGYDVVDTPGYTSHTVRSTGSPMAMNLRTRSFAAVHPETGETHHFHVEERPWLPKGTGAPAHSSPSFHDKLRAPAAYGAAGAKAAAGVVKTGAGKVAGTGRRLVALTRGFGASVFPKNSAVQKVAHGHPVANEMAQMLAGQRNAHHVGTWERTAGVGSKHEEKQYHHLVNAGNPQIAAQRLYEHVSNAGHAVSPLSYSRVRTNGILHHRYSFEYHDGKARHKVTMMRAQAQVKPTLKPAIS